MPGQNKISGLIKRFEENREAYLSGRYNETQLRREFIDPFFKELGWDVDNEGGLAEAYKDVIHEDAIKIGGLSKAPDYCFRVGGTRKFFVEAKKPSVNLKEDINPAFQLRRYAWSAKLPLSVLTDFEEFAVYDSRIKPLKTDKPTTARILYFTCQDYLGRWEEIAGIFSREAVLKGSFDKYAQSVRTKKGTAEVDRAFLDEIESWREMLAKNIAMRNPSFSARELNFVVQRTIDRIIFLRICEDRGIETYGTLQALLNGPNVYARLFEIFERADDRYNSGIFHFHKEKGRPETPDELSPKVKIDDDILKGIFKGLYYPESSYEFSVLPVEILGQVYEQFLGQVIHLTDGHRAKIEEKPEVKKAGGVYYTPAYIVDYIVKETVGKLLEGKTPKQVSKLKVLDPACGSGSFLIGAYRYLLTWHCDWYVKDGVTKWTKGKNPVLYQHRKGDWRLTTFEKKRILLNNIYGVDIDSQAVEVTKLSLLLKVLEGESGEVISRQYRLFHERVLPDLGNNIKCGNSLIGPDIYNSGQMELWNNEERLRVNAFDWDKEFPGIMSAGGFGAVIGNPPWGAEFSILEQEYLRDAYSSAKASNIDSYVVFVESALRRLTKNGRLSYIIPDTFLRKDDYLPTRKLFLHHTNILELIETGPVFSKVRDTWCLVFTVVNAKVNKETFIRHRKLNRFIVSTEERLEKFGAENWDEETRVPQSLWMGRPNLVVGYRASVQAQNLIAKIERCPKLGQLLSKFRVSRGEEGSKFTLKENLEGDFFMLIPEDIERYGVSRGIRISSNQLARGKVANIYSHPKIWVIRIQKMRWKQRIVCGFDKRVNSAGMKTLQSIVSTTNNEVDLKYLQGVLSSSLINFWCVNYLADDMNQSYLERLPIPALDSSASDSNACYDRVVNFVDQMLSLHRNLVAAKTDHEKTALQRQIDATDAEIDRLVYQLYGLTEEEIGIVENPVKK